LLATPVLDLKLLPSTFSPSFLFLFSSLFFNGG
jgi:hypothetical protein